MRWTTFLGSILIMAMLAGCYNSSYGSEEKAEQKGEAGEALQQEEQKDAGAIGEEGLLDILEEAEKADDTTDKKADEGAQETEEAPAEAAAAPKPLIRQEEVTSDLTVMEGGVVELKLKAYDPDGDKIAYTFGKPLDQNGRWQTKVGDEGTYKVDVTASDGKSKTVKTITIRVSHKNRPPVIEPLQKIIVNEGDTINLAPRIKDAEGGNYKTAYSGWMTEPRKKTGYDDAGTYRVTITASDGELQSTSYVDIEVRDVNRAPVFEAVVE